MSYILDALKKKESEEKESIPDLSSQHYHTDFEKEAPNYLKVFFMILGAVLITAVLYFTYWLGTNEKKNPPEIKLSETSENVKGKALVAEDNADSDIILNESPDLKIESKPVELNKPVVKKVILPKVERSNSTQVTALVSKKTNKANADSSLETTGSPSDSINEDLSELPAIRYTSHVYADMPKDRFVMLNGRSLGVGQKLPNGISIVEILENDLVLSFKGKKYKIPSLTDVNQ